MRALMIVRYLTGSLWLICLGFGLPSAYQRASLWVALLLTVLWVVGMVGVITAACLLPSVVKSKGDK